MPPVTLPLDINQILKEHEDRLAALERGGRIGNTGLQEGHFIVRDATGAERVRLGVLNDTAPKVYGVRLTAGEIQVDNDIVGSTYGPQASFVEEYGETYSSSYGDLQYGTTHGPELTIGVSATGNLLIILGVTLYTYGTVESARASYQMTGANVLAASDSHACFMATNIPADTGLYVTEARTLLYDSLNPGETTICVKYRSQGGYAYFDTRYLFAIPL